MDNLDNQYLADLMSKRIVKARISELVRFEKMPMVYVTCEGDQDEVMLFEFYPDEISFQPEEFIGKTVREAFELRRKKDLAYLKS